MEPFQLTPACKDYLWGGTRLKSEYGKRTLLEKVAESWELSCHRDGPSTVAAGSFAGWALPAVLAAYPQYAGTRAAKFSSFPVLIKLIDAADKLSVQVHPGDEYAQRVEGEPGKTEMWYIVEAAPGAELLYGLKKPMTKEAFRAHLEAGTLEEALEAVPVKAGDVFFIASGTLHAIGKGIVIAEIQQNSNTTYRVYDYDRVGADGSKRPLHVEKALEVAALAPAAAPREFPEEVLPGRRQRVLASCEYFTVERVEAETEATLTVSSDSFAALTFLSGAGVLVYSGGSLPANKGDTFFLPAGLGNCSVRGRCMFLKTSI